MIMECLMIVRIDVHSHSCWSMVPTTISNMVNVYLKHIDSILYLADLTILNESVSLTSMVDFFQVMICHLPELVLLLQPSRIFSYFARHHRLGRASATTHRIRRDRLSTWNNQCGSSGSSFIVERINSWKWGVKPRRPLPAEGPAPYI